MYFQRFPLLSRQPTIGSRKLRIRCCPGGELECLEVCNTKYKNYCNNFCPLKLLIVIIHVVTPMCTAIFSEQISDMSRPKTPI